MGACLCIYGRYGTKLALASASHDLCTHDLCAYGLCTHGLYAFAVGKHIQPLALPVNCL